MEKSNQWLQRNKFFVYTQIFFFLIFGYCHPADPNYRTKPLENMAYSGFIARNFFQVVVEVKLSARELTILEEREHCKEMSLVERDKKTLKILQEEVSLETPNQKRYKFDTAPSEEEEILNSFQAKSKTWRTSSKEYLEESENPLLVTGEFAWFLDSLVLFKEDYSQSGKCIFVYRIIKDGLFEKVQSTKLTLPQKSKVPTKNGVPKKDGSTYEIQPPRF